MVKQESVDKVGGIVHVPQPHTPALWLFHSGNSPNSAIVKCPQHKG